MGQKVNPLGEIVEVNMKYILLVLNIAPLVLLGYFLIVMRRGLRQAETERQKAEANLAEERLRM